MCNEAYRRTQLGEVAQDWGQTRLPLRFPEGKPNFPALDSIRITDRVEIIRISQDVSEAEMVTRRWSWPGPKGKPVYNYRSDGREFRNGETSGRCLIPVEGFFEFTAPPAGQKLKSKWAFTVKGLAWFCIAGVWRTEKEIGEAFSMLTCPPGADIAPYHDRQVVVLAPENYAGWITGETPANALCQPLPEGTLDVARVR